jgi:hypothetical protein
MKLIATIILSLLVTTWLYIPAQVSKSGDLTLQWTWRSYLYRVVVQREHDITMYCKCIYLWPECYGALVKDHCSICHLWHFLYAPFAG